MAPKSLLLLLAPALLTLLALPCSQGAVSNAVTEWSFALQKVLTTYNIRHQIGLRYYALLHQTQYQVLNAKARDPVLKATLNDTVLVAVAGHFVLSTLLPDQQSNSYDGLLAAQVGTGRNISAEYDLVKLHALYILRRRLDDTSNIWANFIPAASGTPGPQYSFTPGQTFAIYPQNGYTTPFFMSWDSIPSNYTPPDITSSTFLSEVNEVYLTGGKTAASTLATTFTKQTADFWADGTGTSQHGGHWNSIAISLLPSNLNVYHTARVLTYLNGAAFDANIVTWKLKYTKLFWRPITAINQGFGSFTADPTWAPYLGTPAHPEYPSGHSTTAAAFGRGLANYLGTDSVTVTVSTEGKSGGSPLTPRTYTRLSDIVREVSESRIYGGVHYRTSVLHAEAIGAATADAAKARFGIK